MQYKKNAYITWHSLCWHDTRRRADHMILCICYFLADHTFQCSTKYKDEAKEDTRCYTADSEQQTDSNTPERRSRQMLTNNGQVPDCYQCRNTRSLSRTSEQKSVSDPIISHFGTGSKKKVQIFLVVVGMVILFSSAQSATDHALI